MSDRDETPASTPGTPRKRNVVLWIIPIAAFAAVTLAVIVNSILPPPWRPQLDVKNTGTSAVMLSLNGESVVTAPGKSFSTRISAGDTLMIYAGDSVDAPSHTVSLPAGNPKPWSLNPIAQRFSADVNADDPQNIRFENRRFEEISMPPSPSEPW